MFRRKIYQELDEIQRDINQWLYFYNRERPHSGRYCYGKTPWQTWESSKGLAKEKQLESLFIKRHLHKIWYRLLFFLHPH
jgi:hypothetical protein